MPKDGTEGRGRIARGALALLIALSLSVAGTTLSSAAPSPQDVRAAKEKLDALNERLSLLVEQYDQEKVRLAEIQSRLAQVRVEAERARATAERALSDLNARAAQAYQGVGSELELLLGAATFAEFSDRLEFIGNLAQANSDVATTAATARQRATWAADQLAMALDEQQQVVAGLREKESEIRGGIAEARALYEDLNRRYHDALAARSAASAASATSSATVRVSPPPGGPPPALLNPSAQAAIDAAYSVIGTPYQWGGSSPETGFDCSGFTMWAWAHAGVSLPHSSQMQYEMLPHVAREDLQPGDLVFFYSPIHHVGIYVGGGRMIDSPHTGTVVQVRTILWSVYVGAARP